MTEEIKIDKTINLKGEVCPFPWVKAKKTLAKMESGQILRVIVDHAPAAKNIPHNFKDEGQRILGVDKLNELDWQIIIKREK
ncbi:MAG: sulfurtransferase TusA family protein [bacterium]